MGSEGQPAGTKLPQQHVLPEHKKKSRNQEVSCGKGTCMGGEGVLLGVGEAFVTGQLETRARDLPATASYSLDSRLRIEGSSP